VGLVMRGRYPFSDTQCLPGKVAGRMHSYLFMSPRPYKRSCPAGIADLAPPAEKRFSIHLNYRS
jgi:hypothetical protein